MRFGDLQPPGPRIGQRRLRAASWPRSRRIWKSWRGLRWPNLHGRKWFRLSRSWDCRQGLRWEFPFVLRHHGYLRHDPGTFQNQPRLLPSHSSGQSEDPRQSHRRQQRAFRLPRRDWLLQSRYPQRLQLQALHQQRCRLRHLRHLLPYRRHRSNQAHHFRKHHLRNHRALRQRRQLLRQLPPLRHQEVNGAHRAELSPSGRSGDFRLSGQRWGAPTPHRSGSPDSPLLLPPKPHARFLLLLRTAPRLPTARASTTLRRTRHQPQTPLLPLLPRLRGSVGGASLGGGPIPPAGPKLLLRRRGGRGKVAFTLDRDPPWGGLFLDLSRGVTPQKGAVRSFGPAVQGRGGGGSLQPAVSPPRDP